MIIKLILTFTVILAQNVVSAGGDTLRIPVKSLPTSFDPHEMEDMSSMMVVNQIHRGLFKFNESLKLSPELAKNWEFSHDKKNLKIQIKDAKFADGTSITSHDIVRSIKRIFRKKAAIAEDLVAIRGASNILKGGLLSELGVYAPDSKTVEFALEWPSPLILYQLAAADVAILPPNVEETNFREGAGPYKIKSITDKTLSLEVNKNFNGTVPKFRNVMLVKIDEKDAPFAALKGDLDTLDGFYVPNESVLELERRGWKKTVSSITRSLSLILNPDNLSADDRKQIFSIVGSSRLHKPDGNFKQSFGIVPSVLPGALMKSDLTELLKTGSASEHLKLSKKTLTIVTLANDKTVNQLYQSISKILRSPSLKLVRKDLPMNEYLNAFYKKHYDVLLLTKLIDYPDAYADLSYYKSTVKGRVYHLNDINVDTLLLKAAAEFNEIVRHKLYMEIQKKILSHWIYVPLFQGTANLGLWGPRLKEIPSHPLGPHSLLFESLK